jgi:hypothetical protein
VSLVWPSRVGHRTLTIRFEIMATCVRTNFVITTFVVINVSVITFAIITFAAIPFVVLTTFLQQCLF